MKNYAVLIIACVASTSLFSSDHVTYNCIQGTNFISFSFSTETNEAAFCFQDGLGEGFRLEKTQITARSDRNVIQATGIVYGHSRYFGVNAFF